MTTVLDIDRPRQLAVRKSQARCRRPRGEGPLDIVTACAVAVTPVQRLVAAKVYTYQRDSSRESGIIYHERVVFEHCYDRLA